MLPEDFDMNNENSQDRENVNEENVTVSETENIDDKNNGNGQEKTNWAKELRDWVIAIAAAVIVALVVRNYASGFCVGDSSAAAAL